MTRESVYRNQQTEKRSLRSNSSNPQHRAVRSILGTQGENTVMDSQTDAHEMRKHNSLFHVQLMNVNRTATDRQVHNSSSITTPQLVSANAQPKADERSDNAEMVIQRMKPWGVWGNAGGKQVAKPIGEQFPTLSGDTTGSVGGKTGTFTAQQPKHLQEGDKTTKSIAPPPLVKTKVWPVDAIVTRVRAWNQHAHAGECQEGLSMEAWESIKTKLSGDKTKANNPKYHFLEGEGTGLYDNWMQVKIVGNTDLPGAKKATYHIAYEKIT